jgi:hypothetical protein
VRRTRDPDREIPLERPAAVAPGPPNYPEYALPNPAGPPADHVGMRVVQNGASALGGAGGACGAIWLYRRRTRLAV